MPVDPFVGAKCKTIPVNAVSFSNLEQLLDANVVGHPNAEIRPALGSGNIQHNILHMRIEPGGWTPEDIGSKLPAMPEWARVSSTVWQPCDDKDGQSANGTPPSQMVLKRLSRQAYTTGSSELLYNADSTDISVKFDTTPVSHMGRLMLRQQWANEVTCMQ